MEQKEKKETIEKKKQPHHGRNVKWFRKQKGYSQEYIATLFAGSVSQQQISDWENEEVLPIDILNQFAVFLDIGVSWLKDTILDDDFGIYSQDGDYNTNFQKNDHIVYTVHNPLEAMERVYKDTTKKMQGAYADAKETYKSTIVRLEAENNQLRTSLMDIIGKIADKI